MAASLTFALFMVIMVCSADNEQGSKSRTDESMPHIIEHPSDLAVRRDQPATMNCRADGNPEPTIEWYRNGELVNFSKGHNSLILGGSLFFLHIKGKSDEGVYTCVARNRLGTAISRNASLTIAVLKDEFRQEPLDKVVIAGRPVVIECSPPKGQPEPTVTWRKNGVLLDRNNSRYTFGAGGLSISRILSSDAGVYMCVASNQAGERTSRGAVISVLEIPQFTNKPTDVVAKAGSAVQFVCGAQGSPKPIVQWSKEQGALPTGRYAVTNENTLCLQRVTIQDSGKYICTARSHIGAVSAFAQLVVQDPLDTGQIVQELSNVKVHLDVVGLNGTSVRVQWKASSSSRYTEGYTMFYRPHTPSESDWEKWGVIPVNKNTAVISGLRRGQKYEFKVRPYGWMMYGVDSNIRHVVVPEEVPGPAPQDVNITLVSSSNGSIIVSWEPPPQDGHIGNIKAYKIWCFGNETLPQTNWTVDGRTRSLEIAFLPIGIEYQVQVAAIYSNGMGKLSNPKSIFIEAAMMKEDAADGMIPLDLLLQVVKHPAFIATVGGATWLMLMVAVIYLCQRNSKRYSKKKHSGLYRFASEDTIIKHRMDTSDSPWLSNTWKSASCSRNYSSTTSMNSQLLWMESKDTTDFHKSTISFERKSDGSRSQIIPLVPDSSMYGALFVDLPGKDLTTFQSPSPIRPPGMGVSSKSGIPLGLYDHNLFPHCHGSANNLTHGGARNKIPGKPMVPVPPNVSLKEPWSHKLKRELHHVNSAPLSPYFQTDSGSVPSVKSVDGNPAGKGEYAKVMKTFSSPKILHYTTSLKVMDLLPYSSPLPPPPAPPPEEEPSRGRQDKPVPTMATDPQQDNCHKPTQFSKKKPPPDSLPFRRMSSVSLPIHDDTVLTPDDVAHYLEFNEHGDRTRHPSESDSTLPRPFSTSSNTYGYICSPSELAEGDAADEDDDLDLGELSSLKSYRKYCETPTSSISEYESSMAGSLVNGWGSVSEDNYTSARCSMVSSSDGSFLMDANFAKALALAVDSFCLGINQSESAGADRISTDFSPSASPLDGLLAAQSQGDGADLNGRKPKANPLPVLDWNIDWMEELEAKYRHKNQTKPQYPFSKKVEPFK